ncbi:hypothetical protein MoryE10_12940 [Methylogaea oryzae]|uniref:2Fe-2S ferredoxin-type domain-containing protein n=1 Tax=Methylogaea oryzae TaxID=1295382 RepID=A0A8D4VM51_9GAMM|nr:hypothetical protein MoryE10_12940 [Methylogaea oryzae]
MPAHAGQTLKDALNAGDVELAPNCGGGGACGECALRVLSGAVTPTTDAERLRLSEERRALGWRLACQARLLGDVDILLSDRRPAAGWDDIPAAELEAAPSFDAPGPLHPDAVAVDLGSTHIRLSVWRRGTRQRLAACCGRNPQTAIGTDVLSRLAAAAADPASAHRLAAMAVDAIGDALRQLACEHFAGEPIAADRLVIVGNTAMLALLTEGEAGKLLDPLEWQHRLQCRATDLPAWRRVWRLPETAEIQVVQPLGGFVGSDLLADVAATGLAGGGEAALLVDVGTNTELALWDGSRLWVTATPGGPAFEGVGISCGMSAEAGALYRLRRDGEDGALRGEVLGGGPALGLCGSGLVDAVAVLRQGGVLHPSGRFIGDAGDGGYPLADGIALQKRDVDALQRAKAAVAAAAECLLLRAGLKWRDVRRLCLCGAFGRHLHVPHAQAIGLLPGIAAERIELHANAALTGCELALLAPQGPALLEHLRERSVLLNLSLVPEFEDRFIENLRLRPLALDA